MNIEKPSRESSVRTPSETRIIIEDYDIKLDKTPRKSEGVLSDFIRILFGFK